MPYVFVLLNKTIRRLDLGKDVVGRMLTLEVTIPPSAISSLSSGEFVGMVADNPSDKIILKTFHCEILNKEHINLSHSQDENLLVMPSIRQVSNRLIRDNYKKIKSEIEQVFENVSEALLSDPTKVSLIIKK